MASFQGTKINPSRFHYSQLKFYIILIPAAIFTAFPILYIFSTAFKPMDELFAFPPSFFVRKPTGDNFKWLFAGMETSGVPMPKYLLNSLIITAVTVIVTIIMSVAAGYILSKKKFRFRHVIFELNTLALMFVNVALSIPRFLVIVKLQLFDTFIANILPLLAMPIGLFLVKQFIDQLPDSLIEAAKIDGAGDFTILRKIIIPLTSPALATVAILAFQAAWAMWSIHGFISTMKPLNPLPTI